MPPEVSLHSVTADSTLVAAAQALFRQYREFLETIESTHSFDFERFRQEIDSLPEWYTGAAGEVLLACAGDEAAACIAFRAAPDQLPETCEIKRLFVAPAYRRRGLSRRLIAEALGRATERGFTRAILDTDIVSMKSAYRTYRELGFREYTAPGEHPPSLRFLECPLPWAGA